MGLVGYSILIIYFLILILIGVLCSRKQESISDFFLAGRTMPAWVALAAVVATETSAVTFMGAPAMAFATGGDMSFLQVVIGYIVARVILALFFLPKFFEHEIVTIYQFIGSRFGGYAQRLTGILFFITRALAAGVRHYAAALVIAVILDVNVIHAIIVTGMVSLIYSSLGGLSAVIWTEVVQLAIMILGGILAFVYLLFLIPEGMGHILDVGNEFGKLEIFHFFDTPKGNYSFLMGLLGGMCLCLATHGADQDMVQRLLSCRSLRSAQGAIIGSGFFVFAQFAFFLFIGIMLFVFYQTLPEDLDKADQLLPYFAVDQMHPVAAALVIAAILSAALSSTASALNSLSSTTMSDFVIALRKKPLANNVQVTISRLFTFVWTAILIVIAILASEQENILETGLSIPSYTYGSLLAAFLLGIFTRFRHQWAIMGAMVMGVFGVLLLAKLEFTAPWVGLESATFVLYLQENVHWTWYVPFGTVTTLLFAYIIQFVLQFFQYEDVQ